MKKMTAILGIAAMAGLAYKVLTKKTAGGSTLLDDLTESASGWCDKLNEFVANVKDRLMPDMKGPNGENVYTDMYKRNYYTAGDGTRVYMEEA